MSDRVQRGMEQGRAMLGDRWERIAAGLREIDPDLAEEVIGYAYGEIYPRKGLDLRSREFISITALTIQGLGPQLQTHVHAALDAGLTEAELMETFLHMALYVGFPRALFGAQQAREVLRRRAEARPRGEEPGAG